MTIEIIDAIKARHRRRCFAMDGRKRHDLSLGALVRTSLGWSKDKPAAERKRIATAAQRAIKNVDGELADVIAGMKTARAPFDTMERDALKAMASLAKSLPVWAAFGAAIRGFGPVSLAIIVAEAGDLDGYATDAKLWKRMGLAPGQGRVPKGLSAEKRKEAWIERGYSPKRRSRMWNIGDALIKGNRDGKYRAVYLARKEYELARNPEMTKMHAHRRAQHYMEKRLLRDLWRAWRRPMGNLSDRTISVVAAADQMPEDGHASSVAPRDYLSSADLRQ